MAFTRVTGPSSPHSTFRVSTPACWPTARQRVPAAASRRSAWLPSRAARWGRRGGGPGDAREAPGAPTGALPSPRIRSGGAGRRPDSQRADRRTARSAASERARPAGVGGPRDAGRRAGGRRARGAGPGAGGGARGRGSARGRGGRGPGGGGARGGARRARVINYARTRAARGRARGAPKMAPTAVPPAASSAPLQSAALPPGPRARAAAAPRRRCRKSPQSSRPGAALRPPGSLSRLGTLERGLPISSQGSCRRVRGGALGAMERGFCPPGFVQVLEVLLPSNVFIGILRRIEDHCPPPPYTSLSSALGCTGGLWLLSAPLPWCSTPPSCMPEPGQSRGPLPGCTGRAALSGSSRAAP